MARGTKTDEVANELHRRILERIYEPGQRLPSERDLADEMNVSRPTIRTVLLRLQAENAIDIVPREGIFVRSPSQKLEIGPSAPLLIRKKKAAGHAHLLENQEVTIRLTYPSGIMLATPDMAEKMGFQEGEQVLRQYRVYFVDEFPYRIVDGYYSIALLYKFPEYDDNPLQWLRQYAEQSPAPPHAFESVECRMPDETEAEHLSIGRNQPVLDIERWIFLRDNLLSSFHPAPSGKEDTIFAYIHTTANAALHKFTYLYNKANWQALLDKMRTGL